MINGGGLNGRLLNGGGQGVVIVTATAKAVGRGRMCAVPRLAERGVAVLRGSATIVTSPRLADRGSATARGMSRTHIVPTITQVAWFRIRSRAKADCTQYHNPTVTAEITGRVHATAIRDQEARATARVIGRVSLGVVAIGTYPVFRGTSRVRVEASINGIRETSARFLARSRVAATGVRIHHPKPVFHITGRMKAGALPGRGSEAKARAKGYLRVNYFAIRPETATFRGTSRGLAIPTRTTHPVATVRGVARVNTRTSRLRFQDGRFLLRSWCRAEANRVFFTNAVASIRGFASAEGIRLAMASPTFRNWTRVTVKPRLNNRLPAPDHRTFVLPESSRVFEVPESQRVFIVPSKTFEESR